MNRTMLWALTASAAVAGTTYMYGQGTPVLLQPSTPGTAQVGNANVSGRIIASSVHVTDPSPTGQAIVGSATSTTGANFGGFFRSDSPLGRALYGRASATSGTTHGIWGQADSPAGRGVTGLAPSTTGNATGVWGQTASTTGRGIYGFTTATSGVNYGVLGQTSSPNGYGVYSIGNMGATGNVYANRGLFVGAGPNVVLAQNASAATDSAAVLGLSTSSSGSTYGGQFVNFSTNPNARGVSGSGPTGVYGTGTTGVYGAGGTGVEGQSATSSGRGVFGFATATSGTNYGVYGQSNSNSGIGVLGHSTAPGGSTFGMFGRSDSTSGRGVYGLAQATTGTAIGVFGFSHSTSGSGVWGESGATSGSTNGVYGQSASPDGFGVYGHNTVGIGVLGSTYSDKPAVSGIGRGGNGKIGVRGLSEGGNNSYGVQGFTFNSNGAAVLGQATAGTLAVFAAGNTGASGTKAFRIDHPFDPENKYLLHYSTESPVPQNFYVGNVVTDTQGYAWVDLPDYFSEINKNFKYQLTVVGKSFAQAVIWEEIEANRFRIRTNAPGIKVSWRVDADRNDAYVRAHPSKEVMGKEGADKGTYQHPELYNLGPERGFNYDPELFKSMPQKQPAQQSLRSNKKK